MFFRGNEGDPLSPLVGEATEGEHPLDPPPLHHSRLSKELLVTLLRNYRMLFRLPKR